MATTVSPYTPFSIGSLVHVRGRDWVVLPSSDEEVLLLRPLTGAGADLAGIFLPLEGQYLHSAQFAPPDPQRAGDAGGALLLFDAARLAIRSGAAPFRSLGHIAVTPRPYQFVPLVMALRLNPVRMLIADDVGVGKTVEASLIVRELLDRGLARRFTVLCPPHLCTQWQTELRDKFAIEAAIIQPATIGRLERNLPRQDLSIYQYYQHLVISIDYVKSERNRGHFLDNAPDLLIVDEAHICARPPHHRRVNANQHQRYELLRRLADDSTRNLILVTATPHSGIEESFRSLLGLLDPAFDTADQEIDRQELLPFVVQRRRSDLQQWLGADTPFPKRRAEERAYTLRPEYHALFNAILSYCRESILSSEGLGRQQQRVRHWAAIAMLRCVLSSPAAAEAMLVGRARRQGLDEEALLETIDEIDATFLPQVLDPMEEGGSGDYAPTAPLQQTEPDLTESEKRRLTNFTRSSQDLAGPAMDSKLAETAIILGEMLRDGFRPIVFCRYIATAGYLKEWLPKLLEKEFRHLRIDAVTGEIGDEERREKIAILSAQPTRILVATDCLSEGINLQEAFDAVLHYDLPWNPNRLEQREGRVDRFGQPLPEVRTAVVYGADNPVDQAVLDVLIRKARQIRHRLGISIPVPAESDDVIQAVLDTVLLPPTSTAGQFGLGLNVPEVSRLHQEWEASATKLSRDRAYFAQHGIQPDEVARELRATDPVLGDPKTVQRFMTNAVQRLGGQLKPIKGTAAFELTPGQRMARVLRESDVAGDPSTDQRFRIGFDAMPGAGDIHATGRTDPLVAAYCDAVVGTAQAPEGDPDLARCGAMATSAVDIRTAVALLRLRYILRAETEEFAEEIVVVAFRRAHGNLEWLLPWETARDLLPHARPAANLEPAERAGHVRWALDLLSNTPDWFTPVIDWRKRELYQANTRVRALVGAPPLGIAPHTTPD
ncbi:MAG: helicase-related protein, partial [Chloroflexota bacterium]